MGVWTISKTVNTKFHCGYLKECVIFVCPPYFTVNIIVKFYIKPQSFMKYIH
jgi:hypothetical protein